MDNGAVSSGRVPGDVGQTPVPRAISAVSCAECCPLAHWRCRHCSDQLQQLCHPGLMEPYISWSCNSGYTHSQPRRAQPAQVGLWLDHLTLRARQARHATGARLRRLLPASLLGGLLSRWLERFRDRSRLAPARLRWAGHMADLAEGFSAVLPMRKGIVRLPTRFRPSCLGDDMAAAFVIHDLAPANQASGASVYVIAMGCISVTFMLAQ